MKMQCVLTTALLLSTGLVAPAQVLAETASAISASPSATLKQLFIDSDETSLKINPISALFRGDLRYADRYGDPLSDATLHANSAANDSDLKRLKAIDRSKLSASEQISYDVFLYGAEQSKNFNDQKLDALELMLPIDHFNGVHIFFPDLSSGQGAAPFNTLADYENNLKRLDGFVKNLDDAIVRMKQGMAEGVVQPKLVMKNVVSQLDGLLKDSADNSPFIGPLKKFPDSITPADRARLTTLYKTAVKDKIQPAFQRLRDFVQNTYLPACRDSVGLSGLKGGPALYKALVESNTTTTMSPDEIHKLGLSEVARITAEQAKIRVAVGFKGDAKAFSTYLRNDPKFKFKTKDDLIAGYQAIWKRIEPKLPGFFSLKPKTAFEIRPVPAFAEANQAGAYYNQGTPDGKRPGVFYANTYDLPSRTSPTMETLFMHEAVPGHHFQISLAQEDESLPPFQRFGGNTAYVEGWALYAESLGTEMGMYTDPYQLFGHLDDEMLRAMRLVVDTGIHAQGWSRDQAIAYMLDNSSMGATDAKNEVERYIAYPGQALAYKIGQLTIRRLRTNAETVLGPKFDVRIFHAQVLGSGALPMAVLENKINGWVKKY